ncbi:MAG TPA: AtpZ/AtpI family protein [Acidimicrobiales bacterium]|nr:AtpZ/AtpI family protein [Acidimicrobiales bacterium]
MSDLAARRQINRGYDDGLARAIELVVTPLIFGGIGFLVDGRLGTRPAFTIGLGIFGVVGIFAKLWLGYDREMRAHEATLGSGAGRQTVTVPGYLGATKAAVRVLRDAVRTDAAAEAPADGTVAATGDALMADRKDDGGGGA